LGAGIYTTPAQPPPDADRIALSLSLIHNNQPGKAIPILDAIVAEDANNAAAWNNLCVAHTMQMAYNVAIDDCNRALRITPGFELARNNLEWAKNDERKAIEAIATREQLMPEARDAGSYLAEGLDDLHVGRYDDAIAAWQRTLELDPRNAYAADNIGMAYMGKGQQAMAIKWFEKAAAMDPAMELAKKNLARARDEEAKAHKAGAGK
jgi:tetratricopeptide (TPR) repeat protein